MLAPSEFQFLDKLLIQNLLNKAMISIGSVKAESKSDANNSKFWRELLNSTQLISKNASHFPEIKSCRLRMAYSKL
jgi:hypothetical protein